MLSYQPPLVPFAVDYRGMYSRLRMDTYLFAMAEANFYKRAGFIKDIDYTLNFFIRKKNHEDSKLWFKCLIMYVDAQCSSVSLSNVLLCSFMCPSKKKSGMLREILTLNNVLHF